MEKTMLGHAGFFTRLRKSTLNAMIDVVKGVEPESGYGSILQVSEVESAMRQDRVRKTKTVCTYCGVGCSFDVWTKDRHILKYRRTMGRRTAFRHASKENSAGDTSTARTD
jgi:formate dehydrogenase major subunit